MDRKINLASVDKEPKDILGKNREFILGALGLIVVVIAVTVGMTFYAGILSAQDVRLTSSIADTNAKIETYKDIEEKKSIITLKINEIEKIYTSRFDYVKAIDDVQKLFSYRIIISAVRLSADGTAEVTAVKNGDLVISEQQALATNIKSMVLNLTVTSSDEIQQTVDGLKTFLDKGLTGATVLGSTKTEDGFDLQLVLTFGEAAKEPAPVNFNNL